MSDMTEGQIEALEAVWQLARDLAGESGDYSPAARDDGRHTMIPPNLPGQYLCVECRQPWPCTSEGEAAEAWDAGYMAACDDHGLTGDDQKTHNPHWEAALLPGPPLPSWNAPPPSAAALKSALTTVMERCLAAPCECLGHLPPEAPRG